MMIPSKRAKIVLEFGITGEVLMNWPEGLGRVGIDVKGIYGDAEYVDSLHSLRDPTPDYTL
jgi:hypothetical protein